LIRADRGGGTQWPLDHHLNSRFSTIDIASADK
jgi:hypothetical protein